MTLEFLAFANVFLLARLVTLLKDQSPTRGTWARVSLVELAILALGYRFSPLWVAAAVTVVVVNALTWLWDARQRRNLGRLVIGGAGLLVMSVLFSPAGGLTFRPWVADAATRFAEWTTLTPFLRAAAQRESQLFLFGLLIASNEANLAIRAVFDWLDLKPRMPGSGGAALAVDQGEYSRGRVIGILERALLFVFVLRGEYGAIGFILAAKAFTRFRALDDRPFAEYVLIGTLLSASLALLTALVVQRL